MDWLRELRGAVVGLDTAPLIYFLQDDASYGPVVQPFFEAMDRGDFSAVTSTLTLCEVLAQPFRQGAAALVEEYRSILLNAAHLTTVDVTPEIAEAAARLRAEHGLRTPDAVQIATAVHQGASFLLTNDLKLRAIPVLKVVVLADLR